MIWRANTFYAVHTWFFHLSDHAQCRIQPAHFNSHFTTARSDLCSTVFGQSKLTPPLPQGGDPSANLVLFHHVEAERVKDWGVYIPLSRFATYPLVIVSFMSCNMINIRMNHGRAQQEVKPFKLSHFIFSASIFLPFSFDTIFPFEATISSHIHFSSY